MADLVVIVPSRGRPWAVAELVAAFRETCTAAKTRLIFAIDKDDPDRDAYEASVVDVQYGDKWGKGVWVGFSATDGPSSMVCALNVAASRIGEWEGVDAIAFMGDDHRPRTMGWDTAYLDALRTTPGLVYGNDLIQGVKLPTQVAISTSVVRALGHMAPPTLKHMYVDNYWLTLGRAAGCITYLPEVVVEHLHPYAGTAPVDEGYLRVNAREVFDHDEAAFAKYWAEHGERDVAAVRSLAVSCG